VTGSEPGPKDLSEQERERLRLAHHRLRKASQELEALLAPRSMRGRWEPVAAPPEVVDTVRADLEAAYQEVRRAHAELLGWEAP
jgi:hypothetical protein